MLFAIVLSKQPLLLEGIRTKIPFLFFLLLQPRKIVSRFRIQLWEYDNLIHELLDRLIK